MDKKTKIVPGSIEHRKKVAEKYNINEQEVIDMPAKNFEAFCVGLFTGEKHGANELLKNLVNEPEIISGIMQHMSEENRNKVLDEFCEPIVPEDFMNPPEEVEDEKEHTICKDEASI